MSDTVNNVKSEANENAQNVLNEAVEEITEISENIIEATDDSENSAVDSNEKSEKAAAENAENTENGETADSEGAEEAGPVEEKTSILKKIKSFIAGIDYNAAFMRLIGSYLLIMAFFVHKLKEEFSPIHYWEGFVNNLPIAKFALLVLGIFVSFSVIHMLLKKYTNPSALLLFVGALTLSFVALWKCENYYFCIAFIILSAVSAWFCYNYDGFKFVQYLTKKSVCLIIVLLTIGIAAFISFFTIYRHRIYWTATFDFGIFFQMYHYMADCLEPLTTCERDKLLSHFAVHFSPIYYVLLPFYYFFPSANTLLISQGILAAMGAIPLMLICRHRKFTNLETFSFCIVYLFSASIIGPCFYDFHENAFLPALLMWFFYAIEKEKIVLIYIFMALVLFVKEDSALYVALISYYCIFTMKKKHHGIIMFSIAIIYFITVTSLMTKFGEGVMTSRTYGNLMQDHSAGLPEVIKTVILNPVYFLTQCVNEDGFKFLLIMLVPLGFLPLLSKKFSHYFLVAPFILMNLASGYYYSKDTGFQYVFGTTTCLIYCALVNYSDIKSKKKEFVAIFMSVATLCTFSTMIGGKTVSYEIYKNGKEEFLLRDSLLDAIPEDASVAVFDSFLQTHIAQREEVYLLSDYYLEKPVDADFVVIKTGYSEQWIADYAAKTEASGYTKYGEENDIMTIYVSPDYEGVE